ncbi:hypothetical protein Tco_1356024 [Tanacetum coccineum]
MLNKKGLIVEHEGAKFSSRGTKYSRGHVLLKPEDEVFSMLMSLSAQLGLIFFMLPIPVFGITRLVAGLDFGYATELSIWISMMHIFLSCSAGGGLVTSY